MQRDDLQRYLDELLEPARFRDYCPNGLQVEGRKSIETVVTGVTASQEVLDAALALNADAVVVHHGYFWRGEDGRIIGIRKKRLATLLGHDINLFAYHLPLDAHAELGNNAQLGKRMGWPVTGRFGEQDLGFMGDGDGASAQGIARMLAALLGRNPMTVGDANRPVRRIGWCSGAAQSYFEPAIDAGADVFVSGEISEHSVHLARESGVPYIAAGHHATERYGVQSLGVHLAERFGVRCEFVDADNPV